MRTSLPGNCQAATMAGLKRRNPPSERRQTPEKAFTPHQRGAAERVDQTFLKSFLNHTTATYGRAYVVRGYVE